MRDKTDLTLLEMRTSGPNLHCLMASRSRLPLASGSRLSQTWTMPKLPVPSLARHLHLATVRPTRGTGPMARDREEDISPNVSKK